MFFVNGETNEHYAHQRRLSLSQISAITYLFLKLWVRVPPYTLVNFEVFVKILVLCLSFVFAPIVDVLEAPLVDNSQLVEEMVEFRESLADLFAVVFARCQVLVQLKNNINI